MAENVLTGSTPRVLEFDLVLEEIAGHAQSALGSARLRELRPGAGAAARHDASREMRRHVAAAGYIACGSAASLDEVLARAAVRGAVADARDLGNVRRTARVIEDVRRTYARHHESLPALAEVVARVPSMRELLEQLDGLLDSDDEVRDDASPELRKIRSSLHGARRGIRNRLERMIREPSLAEALQDKVVTERGGRLVLPVRAGQRDRVPGVVHDASSSGQTLFIEPLAAVEEQNRLAELRGAERDEVRRLLTEASAHVRAASEGLEAGCAAVATIDMLQGIDRWAEASGAVSPSVVSSGVRLSAARHPLLDIERAVPLDLEIEPDHSAVVITGPNTGGKTVALKTLGLAAAMAQAGLPVTAQEAALPVFTRIHADIGDEQSLAANLSTFSGHLHNISAFVGDCPRGSLVLLDELGTGTDPAEGAALGIALVEAFVERGALVLASTHHDALKVFAQRTAGVLNAAMEFDPETLAPTYRLRVGRPGRSNALEIASRLGLQPGIVARARELMADDVVELDVVLRGLEEQERQLRSEREKIAAEGEELRAEASAAERQHEELEKAYREAKSAARDAIEKAIADVRREGEARLAALARKGPATSKRSRADQRADWAAAVGDLRRQARTDIEAAQGPGPAASSDVPAARGASAAAAIPDSLRRGQSVVVAPFGLEGTVLADWDDPTSKIEVGVAGKRMRVEPGNVSLSDAPPPVSRVPQRYHGPVDQDPELDLHGMRVDEALGAVDRHIDRALLAGLHEVRLIHGFGTLRLRDAIQEHLRDRPEVAKLTPADPFSGGAGVTVVALED